jgi:hypothetical protein
VLANLFNRQHFAKSFLSEVRQNLDCGFVVAVDQAAGQDGNDSPPFGAVLEQGGETPSKEIEGEPPATCVTGIGTNRLAEAAKVVGVGGDCEGRAEVCLGITACRTGCVAQLAKFWSRVARNQREPCRMISPKLIDQVFENVLSGEFPDAPFASGSVLPFALLGVSGSIPLRHPDIDPKFIVTECLQLNRSNLFREKSEQLVGDPESLISVAEFIRPSPGGAAHVVLLLVVGFAR